MSLTDTHWTVTFAEPTEYVDRSLATASWWDRYTVQPGTYPVLRNLDYLYVRVDATLDESYRVNRLFTASSAETTYGDGRVQKVLVPIGHSFRMEENDYTRKYGMATVLGQPLVEAEVWT